MVFSVCARAHAYLFGLCLLSLIPTAAQAANVLVIYIDPYGPFGSAQETSIYRSNANGFFRLHNLRYWEITTGAKMDYFPEGSGHSWSFTIDMPGIQTLLPTLQTNVRGDSYSGFSMNDQYGHLLYNRSGSDVCYTSAGSFEVHSVGQGPSSGSMDGQISAIEASGQVHCCTSVSQCQFSPVTPSLFFTFHASLPCMADFDNDGQVGISDLARMLNRYGTLDTGETNLDGQGRVDVSDLSTFLSVYGMTCE